MSARLVLVLFAALAIFASAQEEDAGTCTTSKHGDLSGFKETRTVRLSDGDSSIIIDLEGDINPCDTPFSILGVAVKVCDRAGQTVIRISNREAAVSRSSSIGIATIQLDFYCREAVTPTNP